MSISALCFIAVITAVLSLSVRRQNTEIAFLITLCGCVIIFLSVLLNISSLFETVKGLLSSASIEKSYILILLKVIGLCFLSEFASDCCIDAGQRALADNISLAGKVLIITAALPLYNDVLKNVLSMVSV